MTLSLAQVDARAKGAVPVSMGTSLALEAAFGVYPEREVVDPPPILSVKELWINVRTLIRNCFNAFETDQKDRLLPQDLIPALEEEFSIIDVVVSQRTQGQVNVVFYLPDYSSLPRKFPDALLRHPRTPKQLAYQAIENSLAEHFKKHPPHEQFRETAFLVTGSHPEAFMLTHFPVDLLARYRFKKLWLLESHSGHIKAYPQWHTKLNDGKTLERIPFGAFALQVFGDGNTQFSMQPSAIRQEVKTLAEIDKWTSVSTKDRIRMSINTRVKSLKVRTLLLAFLSVM